MAEESGGAFDPTVGHHMEMRGFSREYRTGAGEPRQVAEVFRTPDLQAVLFFAFFILTDPPTSLVKYPDQLVCGVIVGVASYAVFELVGAAYYLLAGVLVGNVWEAWRRAHSRTRRDGDATEIISAG